MRTEPNPYAENVARGAALLDKELPGWRSMINLGSLIMVSDCNCVLGQTMGSFWDALVELGHRDDWNWSAEHGFAVSKDDLGRPSRWSVLESAWHDLLTAPNPSVSE